MKTTAIYPNRLADKDRLEFVLALPEFGDDKVIIKTASGDLLSNGYRRIVYGDHGPYIEMDRDQVNWDVLTCKRSGVGYYDKYYTSDNVLVYYQRIDVKNLKNPPKDGRAEAFRGNRSEGYADYVPGKVYVDPYLVRVIK